ncbi:MAG: UDP-2,4-diacetamido-2,4,6-trideoxy-beta-L-altropyranose hydrolase [Saprospiraceae bacterium]|jgi:UDP-2,4-diacetamido-2,4,6-trideoxy-beta-L-altropyranose hydrolase
MKTTIIFRADGSHKMGLGHVVRSLALARMLTKGFQCQFATKNPPIDCIPQIKEVCEKLIEIPEFENVEEEAKNLAKNYLTGNEIIVLDGYHFRTEYQRILKNTGCKIVCIDDIYETHFVADAIINHAGGIQKSQYSAEKDTRFNLGLDYVLLRPAFSAAAKNRQALNTMQYTFICLGGADPNNDTIDILKKLEISKSIKSCFVVIGAAYKHRLALKKFIDNSTIEVTVLENISAEKMVETMRLCPIAITSPSTISIEYLTIGGQLYLHQIADNQTNLRDYLTTTEVAFDFSEFPITNTNKIENALAKQKNLIDGKSPLRLRNIFRELEQELHCKLRKTTADDLLIYFKWANEPQTRLQSFSSKPIALSEHQNWFKTKISSPTCHLYLLEYKGIPAGQIRFDIKKRAVLSYSIAPEARGKGLSTYLLKKGVEQFKKDRQQKVPIIGFVKEQNIPSNQAFTKLGYQRSQAAELKETFVYEAPNS